MKLKIIAVPVLALMFCCTSADKELKRPPMGWNSFDCFGPYVVEEEVRANADYMAQYLKQFGWEYVVVDYCWSHPRLDGRSLKPGERLAMDEFGRVLPAVTRFPSAQGGKGFKPLADYVHSKGLKFGIHIMRGIPIQAVDTDNCPVLHTEYKARDIANREDICKWLNHMCGLNMEHPGAQAYLNSLLEIYVSWGVDFIKIDDISRDHIGDWIEGYNAEEIEGYRKAIDNCGKDIVLSLSPGPTPLWKAKHVSKYANMFRVCDDVYDRWKDIYAAFDFLANWNPYMKPGYWPDGDMLPVGHLAIRHHWREEHYTYLTHDEQITMMSLWCIAPSPLMVGAHLPDNDEFTLSLLTNEDVLRVNQYSTNNRVITNGKHPIWVADVPGSEDKYLALFNRSDTSATVSIKLAKIGVRRECVIMDLWTGKDIGSFSGDFLQEIPKHGAGLYRVSLK